MTNMDKTIEMLRGVSTATLTSQLLKRGIRACYMVGPKPLRADLAHFVAPAFTLRFIPAREDISKLEVLGDTSYAARRAIEETPPGHALVIDGRGDPRAGLIGDILTLRLARRGAAAVVCDGPVRDAAAVAEVDLPVFCMGGAAPVSLNVHYGADLQVPIGCGGVAVFPGDICVGDGDGVVVLPQAMAAEIAADAVEQELRERFIHERIAAGAPIFGTYPPNAETLAAFEAWKKQR
jgi:regulator of RNase E activity RraA